MEGPYSCPNLQFLRNYRLGSWWHTCVVGCQVAERKIFPSGGYCVLVVPLPPICGWREIGWQGGIVREQGGMSGAKRWGHAMGKETQPDALNHEGVGVPVGPDLPPQAKEL